MTNSGAFVRNLWRPTAGSAADEELREKIAIGCRHFEVYYTPKRVKLRFSAMRCGFSDRRREPQAKLIQRRVL